MRRGVIFGAAISVASLVAGAVSAHPAAISARALESAAGDGTRLIATAVPRANPSRVRSPAPATVAAASPSEVSSLPSASGLHPFPRPRPGRARVVGRVQDGTAVPVTAYAPATEGAVASLFDAAEAAASGRRPSTAQPATVQTVAPAAAQPALAAHGRPNAEAFSRHGQRQSSLKGALDALKADRYGEVLARRNGLKDPLDRMIVDFFVIRAGTREVSYGMVTDFAARAKGWPAQKMIRTRAEEAIARAAPSADQVIAALGGKAQSVPGLRVLANAYLSRGDKKRAAELARAAWHNKAMGRSLQAAFAKDFASLLTAEDHLTRADRLIGDNRFAEARDLRKRLGKGSRAYVDARLAAAEGSAKASRLLKAVPGALKRRPGFTLAAAELKRRGDDFNGAASLLEKVSPRSVVNGDAWWVEVRIVSRSLAERGKWRRAYKLAAKGFAHSAKDRADQAFTAGWLALTGLKDGRAADKHFAALEKIGTTPLTKSRAAYWRGRAAEAMGNGGAAQRHYSDASRFGYTYYGQLARSELGRSGTGVRRAPAPSASDTAAMRKNPLAIAVRRLDKAGHEHRIWPLLKHMAQTVPTPGQVAIVVKLAEDAGKPHLGLMAAKAAQRRGMDVGGLAYPTKYIPRTARVPAGVDKAVVYAIARQESLFNTGARSPVGAAGLMQLMPRTAAAMARELGLRHSARKLTRDPAYNATLGAAYLKKRLGNFDGSYILTFAAYNAGAGRVREWIERFGDPRSSRVDPLRWVEQIPYPETRNYVQRVMENVQVYREMLGTGRLAISRDLERGRSS